MNNNPRFYDTYETNHTAAAPHYQSAYPAGMNSQPNPNRMYAPTDARPQTQWHSTTPAVERHETREKPRKSKSGRIAALILCCLIAGGGIGAGGFALGANMLGTNAGNTATIIQGQRENTVVNTAHADTQTEMTASEVYAANVNSTVGITTSITTNYFGYQTTAAASGSGFILTESGYIVTNYHVVEDAASIKVTTYDNTTYDAELVGCDESNDVAVLKIEGENLKPVTLGDSDQMNVGDSVIAIGNPLGELTFSLTSGSISALNRNVTIENKSMSLIQTDCAINSGNSGGALFNMYGEVIGITNAKYSSNSSSASIDNIAFAIPMNSVKKIITDIIETGTFEKAYIGVTISDYATNSYQMSQSAGVAIQSVEDGSPAAEAGLQQGDIVTKVNDTEVSSSSEFKSIISNGKAGDIVTLTVNRDGETKEIKVELKSKTESAQPEEKTTDQSEQQGYGGYGYGSGGQFPYMDGGISEDWGL